MNAYRPAAIPELPKRARLPGIYKERKNSGFLRRHDGTLCLDKCPFCLSFPSAKISEIEEEQEDPYLNDRCRGEALLPPEGEAALIPLGVQPRALLSFTWEETLGCESAQVPLPSPHSWSPTFPSSGGLVD